MKVTVDLDGVLLRQAKKLAGEERKSLARVVEEALREHIARRQCVGEPFKLKLLTKKGRLISGTNLSDRDALYERMR